MKLLETDQENQVNLQLYSSQKMNLAEIYTKFGNLATANKLSLEALEIETKLKNFYHLTILYSNLGIIAYLQNQYEEAISHFSKTLSYFDEKDNSFENLIVNSWILGYKVKIALEKDCRDRANKLIEDFEAKPANELSAKMSAQNLNDIEKQLFIKLDLARAVLKMRSTRRTDKYEAEQIYNRLSTKVNNNEELIAVLKGKSELLLDELRALNQVDSSIIFEFNENITQLENIAKQNQLVPLLIETYLLRSKLMILTKDIEQALKTLNEAKILTDKYSLLNILGKLNEEEDLIKSIFMDWDSIVRNHELQQEISKSIMTEYIQKALRMKNI